MYTVDHGKNRFPQVGIQLFPVPWTRPVDRRHRRQLDKFDEIASHLGKQFPAARQCSGDDTTAGCQSLQQDKRQPFIKGWQDKNMAAPHQTCQILLAERPVHRQPGPQIPGQLKTFPGLLANP